MFAEENEDKETSNEEETPISINKKTVDITKRLSNIFNLDEDSEIPIITTNKTSVKIPEQKMNTAFEQNKFDKAKLNNFSENRIEPYSQTLIAPIENKVKETKYLNNSSNENHLNKMITKVTEPIKEVKSNIKPDLNKLNKLFLTEEEDELDFKNINFKKEEKKILNPQAKEMPKSSDIVKNIENFTTQRNEKFKNNENIDEADKLIEEKLSIKNEKDNNLNKNSSSNMNHNDNDSLNNTNISSENPSKSKIGNIDPLTGEPIVIKKESGKKNSLKKTFDPLSMNKSSVQKKNNNDPLSSINPKSNIIKDSKEDNLNKSIVNNNDGNGIQEFPKEEKGESLMQNKTDEETKPSNRVSNISNVFLN